MKKEDVKKAVEALKKEKKRNFSQTFDLIIVLKNIDLKKTDNHIDYFTSSCYELGVALVGEHLIRSFLI